MRRVGLRVLGGFELSDQNGATVALASAKGRALLVYLALNPDRSHARGELAALLWGRQDEVHARGSLSQAVQALRKAVGEGAEALFESDRHSVTLHGSAIEVDAAQLRALAGSGKIEDLAAAAQLYEGALLAGFASSEAAYEDWLQSERGNILKVAADVLTRLAEKQLEAGDPAAALAAAQKLAALDPLDEQAQRLLMRTYDAAGHRSAALEQYRTLAGLLTRELGVEPEAETKALFQALGKRQDGGAGLAAAMPTAAASAPERDEGEPGAHPALPDKPSIAVLPFQNMSGDPEQEYFADGIAEDIITALSKFRWFFVSARNSSFTYKGEAIDIRQVGRELGVRYVLEGSVRKSGQRVRVTAQLIEAATDNHIWAERYDRDLADIFELQDDLQQAVAAAVEPELASAERNRANAKAPQNLDAWDLCQQGLWHMYQRTQEDTDKAIPAFEGALQLDPALARAHAGLARTLGNAVVYGWRGDRDPAFKRELELAKEALRLDDRDSFVRDALGYMLALSGDIEASAREHRIAVELNPNSADSAFYLAYMLLLLGQHEESLDYFDLALRLSPRGPHLSLYVALRAVCLFRMGRSEATERAFLLAIDLSPVVVIAAWSRLFLVDLYMRQDRVDEARALLAEALLQFPDWTCETLRNDVNPVAKLLDDEMLSRLNQAGLPEAEPKARAETAAQQKDGAGAREAEPALPDKPSIAVLAFQNMSGDPEQDYFADGIAEDIITALSRFHQFFVIARNSSFSYKGRAVEVKQIARELGVRYVIEGSVRRAGTRLRITAQLVDAAEDRHIWAEKYDRGLSDIFAVQDEITERVAMAVGPELDAEEMARARRKNIPELGGWELIARANWHGWKMTEHDTGEAEELLSRALESDPDNARIHVALSGSYRRDAIYGWRRPATQSRAMSLASGQMAVDLDKDDELAHAQLGYILQLSKRHEEAIQRFRTAIGLNPNYSYALGGLGIVLVYSHQPDEALELLHRAMQLSPKDPMLPLYVAGIGFHHFIEERYDETCRWAQKALHENPNLAGGYRLLASAHGMADNLAEARAAYRQFDRLAPGVTIAATLEVTPFAFQDDAERYAEGLRRAGMPEGEPKARAETAEKQKDGAGAREAEPALPDKPSIAVLAFQNMSGDPEQDYFADGIAEDIITALSRFHQFFVIARNSSFSYKGRAVEVKQIARELGVRYVIEGSVRRAGERVRITAQLIDAAADRHIWAERYDRELTDIFTIQDEITERIAMAVGPELGSNETARARRKNIPDLGVWELIARANWHFWKFTEKDVGDAEGLLSKALELDPDNARVHAALSGCFLFDGLYSWRRRPQQSHAMSMEMAKKAFALDQEDELAHVQLGISLSTAKRHEEAIRRFRTAIKLNPNFSFALANLGGVLVYTHQHEEALELLHKAMRLSPKDPMLPFYLLYICIHHFIEERYDEACRWVEKALHENPNLPTGYRILASAQGLRGNLAEARAAYEKLAQLAPGATIAATLQAVSFAFDDDAERYAEGLRRAGMPE